MIGCDDVLAALAFGQPLDDAGRAHVASCVRCRADATVAQRVAGAIEAYAVALPPADFAARVRAAAAPLLARNARRTAWASLARAVGAALLPLPLILVLDVLLVRAVHALVSGLLPEPVGLYVTVNYAVLLALLLALTYGAVPILAERQARLRHEESHA
jgi:hypothetical protein